MGRVVLDYRKKPKNTNRCCNHTFTSIHNSKLAHAHATIRDDALCFRASAGNTSVPRHEQPCTVLTVLTTLHPTSHGILLACTPRDAPGKCIGSRGNCSHKRNCRASPRPPAVVACFSVPRPHTHALRTSLGPIQPAHAHPQSPPARPCFLAA